ncbi:RDD family protein [Rhodanobacter sp. AS-Z3]|uniref:RDD family protein n=1 Tax=Rhodanobacter sp. AS-Z3 TaxID=3031330 RepID=UPI002478AE9C|nr:RDD family protein [Rhodanobacter sp. AS-Z3]WEN14011.1 RDD family protein [Rhodanobacter sp. AS-Z3]
MSPFAWFFRRLLALFVDYLILSSVNLLLQPLLLISYLIAASSGPDSGLHNGAVVSLLLVGQLVPVMVYFWLLHASDWHATPGKLLLGIEVRAAGARSASLGLMGLRSLYALLTLLSCGLGYLWMLCDRGRALHDRLGSSVVVRRGTDPSGEVVAVSMQASVAILYVVASYLIYALAVIPCALVFSQWMP